MNAVFADSFYFFACLNDREAAHTKAREFTLSFTGELVTTGWVLTEVADGLSHPRHRALFVQLDRDMRTRSDVHVVPCSESWYRRGIDLYTRRPDKDWSLTDCISFAVMEDRGITEALTGDHHFEQAGFTALLK